MLPKSTVLAVQTLPVGVREYQAEAWIGRNIAMMAEACDGLVDGCLGAGISINSGGARRVAFGYVHAALHDRRYA